MRVTRLALTDFRNYHSADVALEPGPNLFVGSNGQGKTNLVESLVYLSSLGSHRVSSEQALIRQGADAAIIRARLQHADRELLVEVQLNRSSPNRAQVNRAQIKPRELPRYSSTVLFAPEDLALVRGEPSGRRRFMDELLILRSPRFAGIIADYDRVLRQRNTLLKSARATGAKAASLTTLDVWDDKLVALGSELIEARATLVSELQPEVAAAYYSVAGDDHHARLASQLSVLASDPDADPTEAGTEALTADRVAQEFRNSLERLRRNELERGVTLVGPHRDDLLLELNGMPARGFASHGESWSFALSLKLASAAVLRRESATGDPVLVLDDVFAELDESRRARLAAAVADFEQVLITAAVFDDVPDALAGHTVRIERGTIVETSGGAQ
ncbi:DNA replication/repair protein RecF [Cryobacterium sp. BB307]|uniref:DNA replication/repair protein RecF n=1 Tax=Cryobacterium sp. BB307 TaxID=2716317 RepID=UPI0014452026